MDISSSFGKVAASLQRVCCNAKYHTN
jgi:hypothetical protein